jgi:hypothetical protein
MPWLKDIITTGKPFFATDPDRLTLGMWDSSPEQVHSLYFWTKYPPKLTEALSSWLKDYRVFAALTITGWEEVETRVPPYVEQLDAIKALVDVLGTEKTRWRYSPVPNDFLFNAGRQGRFSELCREMTALGHTEVDVSLLQPSPHWDKGYAFENETGTPVEEALARQAVLKLLVELASVEGIRVGVCADDLALLQALGYDEAHCFSTSCIDRVRLDRVFGLDTTLIPENGCTCQLSIDPCNGPQFGCPSSCRYCYVPFTKVKST